MGSKAEESHQVKKARKKLEKQLKAENKLINKAAIDQMKNAIQIWITRHRKERVPLQNKPIELFDENRHSVNTKNKHVKKLLDQLEKEAVKTPSFKPLIGRIKK